MTALYDLDKVNEARAAANRRRAEALLSIAEGATSLRVLIDNATTIEGAPLLRITLRQLLLAQPGWGEERTSRVIDRMFANLDSDPIAARRLTVSWLLDRRTAGRRFMAFADAVKASELEPRPGHPFAASDGSTALVLGGAQ